MTNAGKRDDGAQRETSRHLEEGGVRADGGASRATGSPGGRGGHSGLTSTLLRPHLIPPVPLTGPGA